MKRPYSSKSVLKVLFTACLFAVILVISGCSPVVKINITTNAKDDKMAVDFASNTGETVADVFYSTTNASPEMTSADEKLMSDGLTKAGFSVKSCTGYGVSIDCVTGPDSIDKILPDVPEMFSITEKNGKKSFSLKLTPEFMQHLLTYLPEDNTGYADLLMAPLFTGEEMDKEEYVDTVAVVYGRKLADEANTFKFMFQISTPGTITSVSVPDYAKGTFKGKTAEITATMAAFLSDYKNAVYSVEWK
ncbi:MAG: hypothetical protein K5930_00635 [Treponemataceae bacterium]|nr:hypothetical protein [Treponemataceae bacterium]